MDNGYSHSHSGRNGCFGEQNGPGDIPEREGDKTLVEPVFLLKFCRIYPDEHENVFLNDY